MTKIEYQYDPYGFNQVTNLFLEYMLTRKTVAQFTNYKKAKDDVIMELSNYAEEAGAVDALYDIVRVFEQHTRVKEWWEKL